MPPRKKTPDIDKGELPPPARPNATVRKRPTNGVGAALPQWAETAYRLWCRGQRNYSEIGRILGPAERPIPWETVKRNITKFAALVRSQLDKTHVDALQEALAAEEEVRAEAWRVYSDPSSSAKDKVAALRVIQTSNETLAGLQGVVTKRIGLKHSSDPDNPLTATIALDDATLAMIIASGRQKGAAPDPPTSEEPDACSDGEAAAE